MDLQSIMKKIRVRHFNNYSHVINLDEIDDGYEIFKHPSAPPHRYTDLAYRVVGNGPEKVVFVAGMCVSHDMWKFQEAQLRDNPAYTLLFIDNRGSGDSSSPSLSNHLYHHQPLPQSQQPSSSNSSEDSDSDSEADINFSDTVSCGQSTSSMKPTYSESDFEHEHSQEQTKEQEQQQKQQRECKREREEEFGQDQLNGYTIEAMALDIWAVINTIFNQDTHVHLVGHSMGSMIVQRMALNESNSRRIMSLVLLCGHDGGWFWSNAPSISLIKSGLLFTLANKLNDLIMKADVYINLHFTSSFISNNRDKLRKRYVNGIIRDNDNADSASMWDHLSAVRSHNLSSEEASTLRSRPYPKLVVYGSSDTVVLPRASRQLAGRIGAKITAVQAAHFAMEEAANDINQLIETQIAEAAVVRHIVLAKTNVPKHIRIFSQV